MKLYTDKENPRIYGSHTFPFFFLKLSSFSGCPAFYSQLTSSISEEYASLYNISSNHQPRISLNRELFISSSALPPKLLEPPSVLKTPPRKEYLLPLSNGLPSPPLATAKDALP